mgnify:CR=1 FL=1
MIDRDEITVQTVDYSYDLYNRLVRLRNRVENAWSQVDVQLASLRDHVRTCSAVDEAGVDGDALDAGVR